MYVCMYVCISVLQLEFKGRHDGQQFSLNPYVPSGLFHPYQWEESISKFRVSGVHFSLLFSNRNSFKQTV